LLRCLDKLQRGIAKRSRQNIRNNWPQEVENRHNQDSGDRGDDR